MKFFLFSGPSRPRTETITTTTTTVTSTTTTKRKSKVVKKKVQKRRRKVYRRRRTYVVEYDVDEYNKKFGIKTSKRIIKKRRRKTKKSRRKSSIKCVRRNQGQRSQNEVDAILSGNNSAKGLRKEYPKLHLFGDKNSLDYFSADSDNDDGIDSLNNSIETGDGLLTMSTVRPNIHRNLIRRKHVAINSTMGTADSEGGIDILSNIMDTMNRWHSMSQPSAIEKIKINADGSLNCEQNSNRTPHTIEQPNADILNAPMNSRNDGFNNRNFNNSNGYRANNTNQNTGNYYSQNRFAGRNEQISFQPFPRAGNFNDDNVFANNYQPDNSSPRNRIPFPRQRGNNNNRLLRNQFQPQRQQGLYDGEDIPPIPNRPTQCKYFFVFFFCYFSQ